MFVCVMLGQNELFRYHKNNKSLLYCVAGPQPLMGYTAKAKPWPLRLTLSAQEGPPSLPPAWGWFYSFRIMRSAGWLSGQAHDERQRALKLHVLKPISLSSEISYHLFSQTSPPHTDQMCSGLHNPFWADPPRLQSFISCTSIPALPSLPIATLVSSCWIHLLFRRIKRERQQWMCAAWQSPSARGGWSRPCWSMWVIQKTLLCNYFYKLKYEVEPVTCLFSLCSDPCLASWSCHHRIRISKCSQHFVKVLSKIYVLV